MDLGFDLQQQNPHPSNPAGEPIPPRASPSHPYSLVSSLSLPSPSLFLKQEATQLHHNNCIARVKSPEPVDQRAPLRPCTLVRPSPLLDLVWATTVIIAYRLCLFDLELPSLPLPSCGINCFILFPSYAS
ncbi:hypothetical protein VPH35_071874 [Triticum aestivum]